MLRIDDTDPTRTVDGGEAAILADLDWLGIGWDEVPALESERGDLYVEAAGTALGNGAVRDDDGSVRLDGVTLLRPDGTATYQLATVAEQEPVVDHLGQLAAERPRDPRAAPLRSAGGRSRG